MAEAKQKIWKVEQPVVGENAPTRTRLIRADRRTSVESFLLSEAKIEVATQDDCLSASKEGIEVENASAA